MVCDFLSMHRDLLDPIHPEISRFLRISVNLESDELEVIVRKHHRCRPQAVGDPFAIHAVVIDGDFPPF